MASEERDRSFDQALARHLRSAVAAHEAAANAPAGSASQSSSCLDAETLAAYHERSLLPGELNLSKEHIASCKKCQLILAHLEETDAIPLEASMEEEVFAGSDLGSVAAAPSRASASAVPGHATEKPDAHALRPDRTRRLRLLHGTRWGWLAPAGAIAAGLLVWISLHENRPLAPGNDEETKIAKNLPPPPPPTPSKPTLVTPPSFGTVPKMQSAPNEVASTNGRTESHGLEARQKQGLTPSAKTAPAADDIDKESGFRKDAEREKGDALRRAETDRGLDGKAVGGAVQDKVQVQTQEPAQSRTESVGRMQAQEQAASKQIQNQSNASMPKVAGPAPLNQATEDRKMKAAPAAAPAPATPAPAPPAAAGGVTMNYRSSEALELTSMYEARLIAAPGSTVIWRTGPAGLIEISTDSGAKWSRQISDVVVDLYTGSAVSDRICWVVGRAGAVLLTTDGGAHWKTLSSPLSEDLGGVRATDALHAIVWNLRHTKNFETTDGGATWKRTANP
jgi:hypothetical protein